jgi:hypothetical protein
LQAVTTFGSFVLRLAECLVQRKRPKEWRNLTLRPEEEGTRRRCFISCRTCCQPSDALMVRMAQSAGPLVPETDFQERFFAASILSRRETVPSIPPRHCCHQVRFSISIPSRTCSRLLMEPRWGCGQWRRSARRFAEQTIKDQREAHGHADLLRYIGMHTWVFTL